MPARLVEHRAGCLRALCPRRQDLRDPVQVVQRRLEENRHVERVRPDEQPVVLVCAEQPVVLGAADNSQRALPRCAGCKAGHCVL